MSEDLNFLWPLLLESCPTARLGLSRGKPAVFNWKPGFWPIVGESWEEVVEAARKSVEESEEK